MNGMEVRGPVGQRKGEVLIPGRSRMTRECHVRFLREGCDTTTYQARRAVHGAASLLAWSMHIALFRRLAAYPRSSHFQKDPGLDLVEYQGDSLSLSIYMGSCSISTISL